MVCDQEPGHMILDQCDLWQAASWPASRAATSRVQSAFVPRSRAVVVGQSAKGSQNRPGASVPSRSCSWSARKGCAVVAATGVRVSRTNCTGYSQLSSTSSMYAANSAGLGWNHPIPHPAPADACLWHLPHSLITDRGEDAQFDPSRGASRCCR